MKSSRALIIPAVAVALSACSKTELDRCIDSQMALWEQEHRTYEENSKSYEEVKKHEPSGDHQETVDANGFMRIDPDLLPYPGNPGTREEAEARANLECGKVYAKRR